MVCRKAAAATNELWRSRKRLRLFFIRRGPPLVATGRGSISQLLRSCSIPAQIWPYGPNLPAPGLNGQNSHLRPGYRGQSGLFRPNSPFEGEFDPI